MTEPPVPALARADKVQPVLLLGSIGAGLGLAGTVPAVAADLGPLVGVGVFVLIYLLMIGLDLRSLTQVVSQRRFLRLAVALNFVVNPALAWGIGQVFLGGHPDLRIGLILFLVTPCVGWYLIFTELAGGDSTLGVSLLGVNVVLQVLLLPVYLWAFEGRGTTVDLSGMVDSLLLFLVLPTIAASMTRWFLERSKRSVVDLQDLVGQWHLKTVALDVVIVAMFASQADTIFDNPKVFATLLPAMVSFFAIAFVIALGAAQLAGLPYGQTVLLVFTATSRNSEASLAVAATAFASPLVALTVVIGPVVELPLLVLMVRALRARSAKALYVEQLAA